MRRRSSPSPTMGARTDMTTALAMRYVPYAECDAVQVTAWNWLWYRLLRPLPPASALAPACEEPESPTMDGPETCKPQKQQSP